jgi:squalene-associated FAD-dependent desaturase
VIGAGWSGLACALELSGRGLPVTVCEAAPQAGGRARAVAVRLGDRDFDLDNGQHLLIGAYSETQRLMAEAGVDLDRALLRLPFQVRYPDGVVLRASRLPAPLHLAAALLGARGLTWDDRRAAFSLVLRWRNSNWQVAQDRPASSLFADASPGIVRRLWRPLCLAALNVEPAQASARILLTVLRDSLAGGARAADLLIPRGSLTQVFAAPALSTLAQRGAELRLRSPVQRLAWTDGRWRLDIRGEQVLADAVVLALPPARAAPLLASAQRAELEPPVAALRSIGMAPIATVYLRFAPTLRLPRPAFALLDDEAAGRFGQWVFDRGQLDPANAGVLSVVVSAAGAALARGNTSLAAAVTAQLTADLGLPAPLASAVLAEKRATIVPAPGLQRPPTRLAAPRLYLAGDAAASDYPSTLEGSVRAGIAAARAVAADLPPAIASAAPEDRPPGT